MSARLDQRPLSDHLRGGRHQRSETDHDFLHVGEQLPEVVLALAGFVKPVPISSQSFHQEVRAKEHSLGSFCTNFVVKPFKEGLAQLTAEEICSRFQRRKAHQVSSALARRASWSRVRRLTDPPGICPSTRGRGVGISSDAGSQLAAHSSWVDLSQSCPVHLGFAAPSS